MGRSANLRSANVLAAQPTSHLPHRFEHGHDEPIITTLPEPLDSGISLTTSEHIYLGIDIPSPPVEEPDQKIPSLKEVSTILITSPHKFSP